MTIYDSLNKEQKEAVYCTEGPLLILAGAGSGKTRVLTHRIAYLIDEQKVNPWNILAITFTNKAAGEMRERVDDLVGYGSESIWVSTFHSMCVRILRRHIDRLGYDTSFTIYDTDDQKSIIKDVCKLLQIDTKVYKERTLLGMISKAKDELISPEELELKAMADFQKKKIAQVYKEYEKQLRENNALDFDDLLLKTVRLFQNNPEILEAYQDRFRYIMVDEYQDTNTVQYKLISLLSQKYRNLCVVGDDDQSIYKFRGANIYNILNFEKEFEDAKVIKLEQNYRSTSNILNAANAVIANNSGRKEKRLWTENGDGEKLSLQQFDTGFDEADYVIRNIQKKIKEENANYNDIAILYRTNAQSRLFEEKLVNANIPYKIVGGVNFYARKEIKDVLAYLKTIDNGHDDLAVKRIINVPKRGIGLTSVTRVQESATLRGVDFYEALRTVDMIDGIGRGVSKLESFVAIIEHLKSKLESFSLVDLVNEILEVTGYIEMLQEEGKEESEARMENINELISKVVAYEESCVQEPPTLSGFLEEVALVADIDNVEEDSNYVVLMTLHSAKGLEFPYVYLVGMEDGMFPSYMTISSGDRDELEEERRLCYVGITRAKQDLTLCCAKRRMIHGEMQYNRVSRFVKEIPVYLVDSGELIKKEDIEIPKSLEYKQAKTTFKQKPFSVSYSTQKEKKQYKVAGGNGPGYDVGDEVMHQKFGKGTVTAIVEGGRDYEVTVSFDSVGTKKMFALFAKLQKI